jgi:hypothetical protein
MRYGVLYNDVRKCIGGNKKCERVKIGPRKNHEHSIFS